MPSKLGPKDEALQIRFGGGVHSRASEEDIDLRECTDGENFELDLRNRDWKPRLPFDVLGQAPNGGEIRGFASLYKSDGTISYLVQAGAAVYEWDGDTFTSVGSCAATAQLRGHISHNWQLDDKVIITDLNLQQPVMEWDGTTLQNVTFTGTSGADVIVNGAFAADTDWTKGTGWTISGGTGNCDGTQVAASTLSQTVAPLTVGTRYGVSFTISDYEAGTIRPQAGATNGTSVGANGLYYEEIVCTTSTGFAMEADTSFIGKIDDVVAEPIPTWNGEFRAKYCVIKDERAIFANVYDNGTNYPHMIVGSRTSYYNQITVSNRPSSALSLADPFFLLAPDLRTINGMSEAYGLVALSTLQGSMFKLTGSNAQDFELQSFYRDSGASGTESVTYVGNDIIYGRQGRIESLSGVDRFGDVETDDLSNDIFDTIQGYENWTIVYNSRTQKIYCYPEGQNLVWTLNKSIIGMKGEERNLSPWVKYTTNHQSNFNITAMMNAYCPCDGLEYVHFGDENGNMYRMEGSEGGGDGGSNELKVRRLSKMFTMPVDAEAFRIRGWITSIKKQDIAVQLKFLFQGYHVYDEDITIIIQADELQPYYNGLTYYGGTQYYGSISERFSREKFGISGKSNQFQVEATVETKRFFKISEIGLRFEIGT